MPIFRPPKAGPGSLKPLFWPDFSPWCGAVAQLGERRVRNAEVRGSIPLSSTILLRARRDLRVPFEQAQRFYSALRARRQTVEFVAFPGGNHNASRSGPPAQRIARFGIILDWFGRHPR